MQVRPDLVEREVREGDIVGNHTWTHPNISMVPPAQASLELNTTQRLFEVLTGRSMRLFRPPFFGDAEPTTADEIDECVIAQKFGYLIVGLRIDPDDWQREPTGKMPAPNVIIQRVVDRLAVTGDYAGRVILLHDSGGDRSQTVAALPGLIDALRAQGYHARHDRPDGWHDPRPGHAPHVAHLAGAVGGPAGVRLLPLRRLPADEPVHHRHRARGGCGSRSSPAWRSGTA